MRRSASSKVPFPQANNIDLAFSILNEIGNNGLSKTDVSTKYGIDLRQGSYYLDALWYLGFVEKINTKYFLTRKGMEIKRAPKDEMRGRFIVLVLEHPFIGELYEQCKDMDRSKAISHVASSIFNTVGLSSSTSLRRANSIVGWFDWIKTHTI